jgi:predicted nucleotidyltransferase
MRNGRNRIEIIIDEFKREISRLEGFELQKMLLFGSYARDDAVEGSDIDILLIFKNKVSSELTDKIRGISNVLSLKYDTVISEFLFSEDEFQKYNTPFLLNVKREGIPV